MARFKYADTVAPHVVPRPLKWNDATCRLRVLHQLVTCLGDQARAWRVEREVFMYALAFASSRTAYVHKAVQVLHLLEHQRAAVDAAVPDGDLTALPWMEEQDVHGTSATAACWGRCREKWNTLHVLQGLQLEVPHDLRGGMQCRKCGSHDLNVEMRQTRSADEGMTAFITCAGCGHRW
jgi:DNA-directed RNA polymerase subunit M/transcription elongation factor TFIIS